MWDKPHFLRMITVVLIAVSFTLLAYSMAHYVLQLSVFKLRTVQLTNLPQQVDVNQLNKLVKNSVSGSFFTIDIERTRRAFEQLQWVRKVRIRRQFPWGLEVTLEEHVPIARWNSTTLVNTYGEIFEGQSKLELPVFQGEPKTSLQMTEVFTEFSRQLGNVNRKIVEVNLSPRFAWQLRLDNGVILELGREQMKQRLERFIAVYPYSIATMSPEVDYVDLRYRNGFAVQQSKNKRDAIHSKQNAASKV